MVTGTPLKRDEFIEFLGFGAALTRRDLKSGLRIIVVDGLNKQVIAEGEISTFSDSRITIRTSEGKILTASMEEWGFPKSATSAATSAQYDLNTVFAFRSNAWRRLKYRKK